MKRCSSCSLLCGVLAMAFFLSLVVVESESSSVPIARVWRELTEKKAALKNSKEPISLNPQTLQRFLLRGYRNYSSVLFVTLTDPNCQACKLIEEKWNKAAEAWLASHPRDSYGVFFFTYATNSKDPLVSKLKINQVPVLAHFGQSKDKDAELTQQEDVYTLTMQTLQETLILNWVNERAGSRITPYVNPWPRIIISFLIATIFALFVLGIAHYVPKLFTNWKDPFVWYNIALIPFVLTIAGTVWNAIRHPMMFSQNPYTGKIMLIAPTAQYQFIFEGFIIAALTMAIAILFIVITTTLETLPPMRQRLFFYPLVSVLFFCLWLLLNLFSLKHKFYPYSFGEQLNHLFGLV